jgi:hypothetical protein
MEGVCIVKVPGRFFWRKQGFQFTMGTWMLMSDYTQLALGEFDRLNERFIPCAYFCAAWAYTRPYGGKPSFTEKDVERWIQKMPTEDAQKILNTMLASRIGGESLSELIEKDEDQKKKSGQMTSEITQLVTSG